MLFQARQQAAVAADLLLTWRRCHNEPLTGQLASARLSYPQADYGGDGDLLAQLARIRTAQAI